MMMKQYETKYTLFTFYVNVNTVGEEIITNNKLQLTIGALFLMLFQHNLQQAGYFFYLSYSVRQFSGKKQCQEKARQETCEYGKQQSCLGPYYSLQAKIILSLFIKHVNFVNHTSNF